MMVADMKLYVVGRRIEPIYELEIRAWIFLQKMGPIVCINLCTYCIQRGKSS